jgi:hypothetical protein
LELNTLFIAGGPLAGKTYQGIAADPDQFNYKKLEV